MGAAKVTQPTTFDISERFIRLAAGSRCRQRKDRFQTKVRSLANAFARSGVPRNLRLATDRARFDDRQVPRACGAMLGRQSRYVDLVAPSARARSRSNDLCPDPSANS